MGSDLEGLWFLLEEPLIPDIVTGSTSGISCLCSHVVWYRVRRIQFEFHNELYKRVAGVAPIEEAH